MKNVNKAIEDFLMPIKYIYRFGLFSGLQTYIKIRTGKGEIKVQPKVVRQPILLRSNTSDIPTFVQIFISEEYDIKIPIIPQNIIDCGANTKQYDNVQCLQNGVWNKSANLQVVDKLGLGEHWSFMTDEVPFKTENSITSITIDDVMKQYQIEEIDLLKIDIEGAEKELFFDNYENWLPKTKVLYIELHDRIRKGTATSFFKAISQYDFSIYLARETLICIRN
jgi:FkbM family methyltransferase